MLWYKIFCFNEKVLKYTLLIAKLAALLMYQNKLREVMQSVLSCVCDYLMYRCLLYRDDMEMLNQPSQSPFGFRVGTCNFAFKLRGLFCQIAWCWILCSAWFLETASGGNSNSENLSRGESSSKLIVQKLICSGTGSWCNLKKWRGCFIYFLNFLIWDTKEKKFHLTPFFIKQFSFH